MFHKPTRGVDRVFVHCSASDNPSHDNVATMRRWHTDPKPQGRGWSDVGYHYFIRKDGTLENGRPVGVTPAAQGGNNKGTIAICLHGLKEAKFTEAQFDRLRRLAIEINNAYDGRLTFHGHREVAKKACPVFDYKSVLKLDQFGRLGLSGASKQKLKDASGQSADAMPVLKRGDRGPAVVTLQKLLMIKDDGIFGPKTAIEVGVFQDAHGLTRDNVVGRDTWAKLLANDRIEHDGGD